jgi:ribosomal protein L14
MNDPKSPKRALREEVVVARAGRAAARPLAIKVSSWQQKAALLGARVEHVRAKGQPAEALRDEIDRLSAEIVETLSEWRRRDGSTEPSGIVADAERAAETVLSVVESLHVRLT